MATTVHVVDICRAFLAVIEAPLDVVRGEAFNVGGSDENYLIREVAAISRECYPWQYRHTVG